ncbi:glycosyltransferase family 2 protein [Desulfurobacterium sp.]
MISVIIPTYNAEKYIGRLLDALGNQTIKPDEIIVVDSSSLDRTVNIAVSKGAHVISIPKEEFDHGSTRTLAGKKAKGKILIYFTQDVIPVDEKAIEFLTLPFREDKKIAATYGRQIPYENTDLFGKHLRLFNYPEKSFEKSIEDSKTMGFKVAFLSNSFAAYRRECLESVGWFPENIIFGEDSVVAARLLMKGYKIKYVAEAKVYHSHSYSVIQEFRRYFDVGVFHKTQFWMLETFGKPEKEGIRYVKSELKFLLDNGAFHLLPNFFFRNFAKYLGYKMGYNFDKLPVNIRKAFSMNKHFWNKCKEKQ